MRYSTHHVTASDITAVDRTLRSEWLTCGPKVDEFEEALAEYVGARYAVAVNSGTAALYLAYRAAGIDKYRSVYTTPLTFAATANAALLAGASVQFGDVDRETGNISWPDGPTALDVCAPVHFAGRAARITAAQFDPSGSQLKPYVIEDACHALGARDFDGHRVGCCSRSLAACFSFHPVKPITTGEGGAVTTNDQGFADEVRMLRSHGRDEHGLMRSLSGNFRLPDINAALGLSQLKNCERNRIIRYGLYCDYCNRLDSDPIRGLMFPDYMDEGDAFHLLPVRIGGGRRDAIKAHLNARGIGAQVHYNPIVPLHPYYRARFSYREGMFPEAEAWAREELSLPLHAGMTADDVERVVDVLREAMR